MLVTSTGIRFTWAIKPAQVAMPGEFYQNGYIHSIKPRPQGQLGQLSMENFSNSLFTLSIYDKKYVSPWNKIFKGKRHF